MLILLIQIFSMVYFVIYNLLNPKQQNSENEFAISLKVLNDTIDLYKESILNPKIMTLRHQYDLDPNSRTNSIKAFQEVLNTLISESAKEIMKNYISNDCYKTLILYYNINGLVLYIITQLKR